MMAAQFPVWTGLDLLLDAAKKSTADFKIHLVGNLSEEDKVALGSDSRFIIHGSLEWPAIESLMSKCALGLSAFALHRKGFTEGNVLSQRTSRY